MPPAAFEITMIPHGDEFHTVAYAHADLQNITAADIRARLAEGTNISLAIVGSQVEISASGVGGGGGNGFRGPWETGEDYTIGDLVTHDGLLWIARTDNGGSEPDPADPTDWIRVIDPGANFIAGDGIGLGYVDGNVIVGITDGGVTLAKIQDITDGRILGRSAGSDGPPQEITIGSGLQLSGGELAVAGAGFVTSIAGTAEQITASTATGAVTLSIPATVRIGTVVGDGAIPVDGELRVWRRLLVGNNFNGNPFVDFNGATGASTFRGSVVGNAFSALGNLGLGHDDFLTFSASGGNRGNMGMIADGLPRWRTSGDVGGIASGSLPAASASMNGAITLQNDDGAERLVFYVNGKRFKVTGTEE